jgi:hypothetical protein
VKEIRKSAFVVWTVLLSLLTAYVFFRITHGFSRILIFLLIVCCIDWLAIKPATWNSASRATCIAVLSLNASTVVILLLNWGPFLHFMVRLTKIAP